MVQRIRITSKHRKKEMVAACKWLFKVPSGRRPAISDQGTSNMLSLRGTSSGKYNLRNCMILSKCYQLKGTGGVPTGKLNSSV